jgi:hypothetical protein
LSPAPLVRRAALVLFSIIAVFLGCEPRINLAERIRLAGGIEALKADCLKLAATYEASGMKHISLSRQTNQPATIAALAPRGLQVGRQGDVVLVHMVFAVGSRPYGLYVAPRGCPPGFVPDRPFGARISRIADGVFEYAD